MVTTPKDDVNTLHAYPFELHREVIMEKLMGSTLVRPHLPRYYLLPIEANA
jgi:hypothetical protein